VTTQWKIMGGAGIDPCLLILRTVWRWGRALCSATLHLKTDISVLVDRKRACLTLIGSAKCTCCCSVTRVVLRPLTAGFMLSAGAAQSTLILRNKYHWCTCTKLLVVTHVTVPALHLVIFSCDVPSYIWPHIKVFLIGRGVMEGECAPAENQTPGFRS
jgi:hypothetical protein